MYVQHDLIQSPIQQSTAMYNSHTLNDQDKK